MLFHFLEKKLQVKKKKRFAWHQELFIILLHWQRKFTFSKLWILLSGYHFCLIQTCLGTCLKGSPIYSFRASLTYDLFVHVPRVLNVMHYIQMLDDFNFSLSIHAMCWMILFFPSHSCHVLIKQVWYLVFLLELDSSAPPRVFFFLSFFPFPPPIFVM